MVIFNFIILFNYTKKKLKKEIIFVYLNKIIPVKDIVKNFLNTAAYSINFYK